MERLSEAIGHALESQRDVMLDPLSALIVLLIVVVFAVLRITGKRKSTKARIRDMEDGEFPEDADVPERDRVNR